MRCCDVSQYQPGCGRGTAETGAGPALSEQTALAPDWQKLAAATAVLQNFTLISGGPGTAKPYCRHPAKAARRRYFRYRAGSPNREGGGKIAGFHTGQTPRCS